MPFQIVLKLEWSGHLSMSYILKDLCELLGIKCVRTSMHHPETAALVECPREDCADG